MSIDNDGDKPIRSSSPFAQRIYDLLDTSGVAISLSYIDSVPISKLIITDVDMESYDHSRYPEGIISLTDYQDLESQDILRIPDNYMLMVLRNQLSDEIRAVTFTHEGLAIESYLLADHFGNNEFSVPRQYASDLDSTFLYDKGTNLFTFSDAI